MDEQLQPYEQAKLERFKANGEAIRAMARVFARRIETGGTLLQPTPEEKDAIRRFSGWGGFRFLDTNPVTAKDEKGQTVGMRFPCRNPEDIRHPTWTGYRHYFQTLLEMKRVIWKHVQRMNPNIDEIRQVSIYKRVVLDMGNAVKTSHYTPRLIVGSIANALRAEGKQLPIVNFCDPSAGTAVFSEAFLKRAEQAMECTNIEMDYLTSCLAKCIQSYSNVINAPYQNTNFRTQQKMDVVASNVPFHNHPFPEFAYGRHPKLAVQDYFMHRAINDVRNGGIVAVIVPQSILDQNANTDTASILAKSPNQSRNPKSSTIRDILSERADCIAVARLPNDTFRSTIASADVIILQRNDEKPLQGLSDFEQQLLTLEPVRDEMGQRYCAMKPVLLNPKGIYNYANRNGERPSPMLIGDRARFNEWIQRDEGHRAIPMVDFVVRHSGGIEGIAKDLARTLAQQVQQRLNTELYLDNLSERTAVMQTVVRMPKPDAGQSKDLTPKKASIRHDAKHAQGKSARRTQIEGDRRALRILKGAIEKAKMRTKESQKSPAKRRGLKM